MKKYFLFDLDGTLADTGPGITGCVQDTLRRLGWPDQSPQFLRRFVGPPLMESFQTFCSLDEAAAQRAIQLYRERYTAWGEYQSSLYPGIRDMLARLSQTASLCVATSKREEGARHILEMRGIAGYFSEIVGDDSTRPTKSHVIREVLARLGNPPLDQVIMVGDRSYDVAGARECGLPIIGACYGYGETGELAQAGADYLAASVEDLESICHMLAAD